MCPLSRNPDDLGRCAAVAANKRAAAMRCAVREAIQLLVGVVAAHAKRDRATVADGLELCTFVGTGHRVALNARHIGQAFGCYRLRPAGVKP